jgi:hypothetical protein
VRFYKNNGPPSLSTSLQGHTVKVNTWFHCRVLFLVFALGSGVRGLFDF